MKQERIAVVGSRPPDSDAFVEAWVAHEARMLEVEAYVDTLDLDWWLVSGGARGTDDRAEKHARRRGMYVESWRPRRDRQGKWRVIVMTFHPGKRFPEVEWLSEVFPHFPAAAFWRNGMIVERATIGVKAFPSPNARGTLDTIEKARKAGKLLS